MSVYFSGCEKANHDTELLNIIEERENSVNSQEIAPFKNGESLSINTEIVDNILAAIDYTKLNNNNGILTVDSNSNVYLLDSAYNEYMRAIDTWYDSYKAQYLSDAPTDTTDIEVKMKDINWFYVSDKFSDHFQGFKSLQNKYKELENLWLQTNMDDDNLDPRNIPVKIRLMRMLMNTDAEIIINGKFIKVYDDGTQIKLDDFTERDILLLKDIKNVDKITGNKISIEYRNGCDYWEENKKRFDYSLCDDEYRFIYEAGVYNGYTFSFSNWYVSKYWGDAGLYRKNIAGGIAWRVKADWMDVVLSGTVYLYPSAQPVQWQDPFTHEERYPECTCEFNVQTANLTGCPTLETDYPYFPFNMSGYWPEENWHIHQNNTSTIQCQVGITINNNEGLKVSVDHSDQFCATFGFKHTRKKYKRKWPWSKKKLVCEETKTTSGLTVCVK